MIRKTRGIVLNSIRYKETSIIVRIFTRELGLKSYLVNGVRSQGKSSKIALYQPLTLLDMVVYDKDTGIQRISEAKILHPFHQIPFDFERTSIALFITEVVSRSIFENYQNEWLFDFLQESILVLDTDSCPLGHFPLIFLIEKARYLGFAPEDPQDFLEESRSQPFNTDETLQAKTYLRLLVQEQYHCTSKAPVALRRKLLEHLLAFYAEHQDNPAPIKSLAVIRQLLS